MNTSAGRPVREARTIRSWLPIYRQPRDRGRTLPSDWRYPVPLRWTKAVFLLIVTILEPVTFAGKTFCLGYEAGNLGLLNTKSSLTTGETTGHSDNFPGSMLESNGPFLCTSFE